MDSLNPAVLGIDINTLNEMEEKRIAMLDEAGIIEDDVIDNAQKDIRGWGSYFNENIVRGKDDINFVIRDQWSAVERSEFSRMSKPCQVFNKLYDPIKKILSEERQNHPDLMVRSLTGKAKQEQIDMRADLVRTICYKSENDLIYQSAFRSSLLFSFGAFQVGIEYENPMSFYQTPKFILIPDPTKCAWDPNSQMPHKGDGNFCARYYSMDKEQFFATFPYVTNPVSLMDPYVLQTQPNLIDKVVCFADYFKKEWFPLEIVKLSNGKTVSSEEWEMMQKEFAKQRENMSESLAGKIIERELPTVKNKRQTQDYKLMHYRILQNQVIDFVEWPGKHLPIVFVDGDSSYIDGQQYTKSFIRDARDAQKQLNYIGSEISCEIKNRRREQWMGTADNIIGNEQVWRNPEIQMGILLAKPDPKTGMMPTKQPAWELSQGLVVNFQRASQDIREITGFSESQEIQGRDISGKARRERKLEGSMAAGIFRSNLDQAIQQGGRVVLDLLPYIIGQDERNMIITKADGKTKSMIFNEEKDGKVLNQLEAGDYDIEIDTGPSFAVQQDIALEFFQQTLQVAPQIFPLIADLWVSNLDIQQKPKMEERLRTLVPKDILAKEDGLPPPPKQPSPQEIIMQKEMQLKEIELKERAEELQIRREKHELEKQQMMIDAHKMGLEMHMDEKKNSVELQKADMSFTSSIARILADAHKHDGKEKKKDKK